MGGMTGATAAAVISAAASMISAGMATITVLGRRPRVSATAQRGTIPSGNYFVQSDDGLTIAVAAVNHRDVPVEVETVWIEMMPSIVSRLKIALRPHTPVKALFPPETAPTLPRPLNGRHRMVVRFSAAPFIATASGHARMHARAIVRLSDDRLVRTNWIDLGSSMTAVSVGEND